jgi:hypothetical protein
MAAGTMCAFLAGSLLSAAAAERDAIVGARVARGLGQEQCLLQAQGSRSYHPAALQVGPQSGGVDDQPRVGSIVEGALVEEEGEASNGTGQQFSRAAKQEQAADVKVHAAAERKQRHHFSASRLLASRHNVSSELRRKLLKHIPGAPGGPSHARSGNLSVLASLLENGARVIPAAASAAAKIGLGSVGADLMSEMMSNSFFGAVSSIPGIENVPVLGTILGLDDISNDDMLDDLTKQITAQTGTILGAMDKHAKVMLNETRELQKSVLNETAKLQESISDETAKLQEAISDAVTTMESAIDGGVQTMLDEFNKISEEHSRQVEAFRQEAEDNHELVLATVLQNDLAAHNRQCMEHLSSIGTKFFMFTTMLNDLLERRAEVLASAESEAGTFILTEGGEVACPSGMIGPTSEAECRVLYANSDAPSKRWYGTWAAGPCGCTVYNSDHTDQTWLYKSHEHCHDECRQTGGSCSQFAHRIRSVCTVDVQRQEATSVVREGHDLFNSLSGDAAGVSVDWTHLLGCAMSDKFSSESLLSKYIAKARELGGGFDGNERLIALMMVADYMDAGKMAFSLVDMKTFIVEHASQKTRFTYMGHISKQMSDYFDKSRAIVHDSQLDMNPDGYRFEDKFDVHQGRLVVKSSETGGVSECALPSDLHEQDGYLGKAVDSSQPVDSQPRPEHIRWISANPIYTLSFNPADVERGIQECTKSDTCQEVQFFARVVNERLYELRVEFFPSVGSRNTNCVEGSFVAKHGDVQYYFYATFATLK